MGLEWTYHADDSKSDLVMALDAKVRCSEAGHHGKNYFYLGQGKNVVVAFVLLSALIAIPIVEQQVLKPQRQKLASSTCLSHSCVVQMLNPPDLLTRTQHSQPFLNHLHLGCYGWVPNERSQVLVLPTLAHWLGYLGAEATQLREDM